MQSQEGLGKRFLLFSIAALLGIVGCAAGLALLILSSVPDFYCLTVHRVAGLDSVAYFMINDYESNYYYFQSGNGGAEWYLITDALLPEVEDELTLLRPFSLPVDICDPAGVAVCYRFSADSSTIQESLDGGTSWQTVNLPFRLRSKRGCRSPVVTDAAFVGEWEGSSFLMVGMGTGGVVWRSGRGEWQHVEMDGLHYLPQDGTEANLGSAAKEDG
jgi:hypothetical protein